MCIILLVLGGMKYRWIYDFFNESPPLSSYKYLKDPRINMSNIHKLNNQFEVFDI